MPCPERSSCLLGQIVCIMNVYDQNNDCSVHVNDRLIRMKRSSREQQIIYIKCCLNKGCFLSVEQQKNYLSVSFTNHECLECQLSKERIYNTGTWIILYKSYQRSFVGSISDKDEYVKVPNNSNIRRYIYWNNRNSS